MYIVQQNFRLTDGEYNCSKSSADLSISRAVDPCAQTDKGQKRSTESTRIGVLLSIPFSCENAKETVLYFSIIIVRHPRLFSLRYNGKTVFYAIQSVYPLFLYMSSCIHIKTRFQPHNASLNRASCSHQICNYPSRNPHLRPVSHK